MNRVLFVCLGNINRSRAAEAVMQSVIDKAHVSDYYQLGSADAIADLTLDTPPMGRELRYEDFEKYDLILGMDEANYDKIIELDQKQLYRSKVAMVTCFSSGQYAHYKGVPEPFCGNSVGFDLVLDLLTNCCKNLFEYLQAQNKKMRA